jgi:PAP2 superfamily
MAIGLPCKGSTKMSVILDWNELFLASVANSGLGPTVTARSLQIVHNAIFDAWAAFDPVAIGVHSRIDAPSSLLVPGRLESALDEAIAYAAFTAAVAVYPGQVAAIRAFMTGLGYDPDTINPDPGSPSAIGKAAAQAVLDYRASDFSNAANNFANNTGYRPVNSANPDADNAPGGSTFDPNRWQPLRVPTGTVKDADGNPIITADPASYRDQGPLTPQMGQVKAFSLQANYDFRPQAPPRLGDQSEYVDGLGNVTTSDQAYRDQFAQVLAISGSLTTEQKAIAEFWADGPRTETPPGHWNQLAQDVAHRDDNTVAEDVKLFFALNNALLDAAIATWETKYFYDSIRPASAIRDLYFDQEVVAWLGPNKGSGTILGQDWQPYQQATFVTPPFPEYTSGHSAFSAAAASVLRSFTGSDVFFDGVSRSERDFDADGQLDLLGQYTVTRLGFETLVGAPITLTWETFTEAANEAGISRLYGGIHIQDGDLFARELGANVGASAWSASLRYITGDSTAPVHSAQGTAAHDLLLGSPAAEVFSAGAGNDIVRPNGGGDTVTLGSGRDRIEGYKAALDGLVVRDMGFGDSLVFLDAVSAAGLNLRFTASGAAIETGARDIALDGSFGGGGFLITRLGDDTLVTYLENTADLSAIVPTLGTVIQGTYGDAVLNGVMVCRLFLSGSQANLIA